MVDSQKFRELFADSLNRLDLAVEVLEAALTAQYGGRVEMSLVHSEEASSSPSIRVEAKSHSTWGPNEPPRYWGEGAICWHTSSGHWVRFEFEARPYDLPILRRVLIGDDPSKVFYPWIHRLCEEAGIPVEVVEE